MDDIRIESRLMKRIVGDFISHQLSKKLDKPIGFSLYNLSIQERQDQTYILRIDTDVVIAKEDLKELIWKDRIGSGTS